MPQNILSFSIRGTRLGLDVSYVVEVIPSVKLVVPPEMPPLLRGFIAIKKTLVPVIRLEKLLEGKDAPDTAMQLSDRLIITRVGDFQVAWLADADMEPLSYLQAERVPLPADHVFNHCAAYVLPLTPPVVLLDMAKVLLEGERVRLEQLREKESERLALLGMETST